MGVVGHWQGEPAAPACHDRRVNRAIACLVAVVIAAPGLAASEPKPTRLAMKRTEGTNLHIADGQGAIHWSADIRITVDLQADKKLEAAATGTRGEHNLYAGGPGPSYNTDETTTWTTRWNGTWAIAGDKLVLDLVLAEHKCSHTKTTAEQKPEVLPCDTASKQTQLVCTSAQIKLEDLARPNKSQQVAAWRCNAKDSTDLAESPSQWVLGKTSCIETLGGHMTRDVFRACAP
jgi:hypothetical protein